MVSLFNTIADKKHSKKIALRSQEDTEKSFVVMEVTTSETHGFEAEIVEHEIENGGSITDHIINRPRRLSLNCIMSDTPIRVFSEVRGAAELIEDPERKNKRSARAYKQLKELYENRTLLNVVTGFEVYKNMIIERVSIPRNAENFGSLEFSLELKQISFATLFIGVNNTTDAKPATKDIAQKKVSKGKTKTKTPPAQKTKGSSLSVKIKNGVKKVIKIITE